MIRLAADFLVLCLATSTHPTIFLNEDGECIAMCDAHSTVVHSCYNEEKPLTDCIDEEGNTQLCDSSIIWITDDDYDVCI